MKKIVALMVFAVTIISAALIVCADIKEFVDKDIDGMRSNSESAIMEEQIKLYSDIMFGEEKTRR